MYWSAHCMAVDFLSIAPPRARKALVTVLDYQGHEQEVEIKPITNALLARVACQHQKLRDIFAKDTPASLREMLLMSHAQAIVAAALGHPCDPKYEAAVERY